MTNVDPVFLLDKVPSWVPDLSPGQEQMPGLTSSQLPIALRLGNTVTTDKSMIIENFNKHFSTAGHGFLLATPAATCPAATCPSLHSFSFTQIQIADVLKEPLLKPLLPVCSTSLSYRPDSPLQRG